MAPYEAEADLIQAIQTLVDCSATLENDPLKQKVLHAKDVMLQRAETCCRETVQFLVRSLLDDDMKDGSSVRGALAHDMVWTLHMMAKCSKTAKLWIEEADIVSKIPCVLSAFPLHSRLQEEGIWLTYNLRGLGGIVELMSKAGSSSPALQEGAAWAIHSLADKQRGPDDYGVEWPEADAIIALLHDALRIPNGSLELRIICCKTLRILMHQFPARGNIFLSKNGAATAVETLRIGGAAAQNGEASGSKLLTVAARLMTCLVDGNSAGGLALHEQGALQALVECGFGQGTDDSVLYEVLWAVGQIGGAQAVLEVMMRMQRNENVLKRCLAVFAKQLWRLEDVDVELLPPVLEKLVKITDNVLALQNVFELDSQKNSIEALGGVLNSMAQHVGPGSLLAADQAVQLMVKAVGPGYNELVARSAAASLGHMISGAPIWREPLVAAGFVALLGRRIGDLQEAEEDNVQHQRCFCWAAAIMGGLPALVEAMTMQISSPTTQQAAISSLTDILEDHSECSCPPGWVRSDVNVEFIPKTMQVLSHSMSQHRAYAPVQYQGLHALGLLHNNLPPNQDVHSIVLESVLGSLKSHPTSYKVASGVCSALRSFLSPRAGTDRETSQAATRRAIDTLRNHKCADSLRKLLDDFSLATDRELFSDAAFVFGLVEGPASVVKELGQSKPQSVVLRAGLMKGLFELERTFQDVMDLQLTQTTMTVVQNIVAEAQVSLAKSPSSRNEDVNELIRASEMLGGLLAATIAANS